MGNLMELEKSDGGEQGEDKVIKDIRSFVGITDSTEFTHLSEGEQYEVGQRLNRLLFKMADGALVPLMNNTLTKNDVEKLVSLKDCAIDATSHQGILCCKVEDVKKEEEDVDHLMANADADISDVTKLIEEVERCNEAGCKIFPPWRLQVKVERVNLKMALTKKGTVRKRALRRDQERPQTWSQIRVTISSWKTFFCLPSIRQYL